MMKFLVLFTTRENAPPLDDPMAALQASHSYIDDKIAKGAFFCYYRLASRRPTYVHRQCQFGRRNVEKHSTLDDLVHDDNIHT